MKRKAEILQDIKLLIKRIKAERFEEPYEIVPYLDHIVKESERR